MNLNRRVWGDRLRSKLAFLSILILMAGGAVALRFGSKGGYAQRPGTNQPDSRFSFAAEAAADADRAHQVLGSLPMSFEPNQGQTNAQVRFLARGIGYGLFLTDREAVLQLQPAKGQIESAVVRMQLAGANPSPRIVGAGLLPGKSNYLTGNDPAKWRRNIPQFARVRYQQVYPGVDLVYYGNQGQLEYDFEIAPGTDPGVVRLGFAAGQPVSLNRAGDLVAGAGAGEVKFNAPHLYQRDGEKEQPVSGRFVLRAGNQVGFEVGAYDRSRTLVIDPVLTYSSYLGGSGAETSPSIAVDAGFNIYVAGQTASANFPLVTPAPTPAPLQSTLKPPSDVFVAKLDPSGSTLVFSTYLGGTGDDLSAGIAVDAGSNVYVAGTTNSPDFPMASPANGFQTAPKTSNNHVFLSVLKPDASALVYSTYLSGSSADVAAGLAIDNKANAYVVGTTTSSDFPTTAGTFQATLQANTAFFVSKVNTAGSGSSSLVFSSYFGGGNPATGAVAQGGGIAVDSAGHIYITGGTNLLHLGTANSAATDFPILNAAEACLDVPAVATPLNPPPACPATATATDAFAAKIDPNAGTGAQLLYSTYLGGSGNDVGRGIAVDAGGNVYVTGSTSSTDVFVPNTAGSFQPANAGGQKGFVVKLNNPAANTPVSTTYFSYLGTGATNNGAAIAVDSSQIARVGGSQDTSAIVAFIDTTATTAASPNNSVTTLGTTGTSRATGIALDTSFVTYVTGDTTSANFPIAGTPFQASPSGLPDAFISRLGNQSDLSAKVTQPVPASGSTTITPIGVGNQTTVKYTVTNSGPDPTGGVVFTTVLPGSGATAGTVTSAPGSCGTPVGNTVLCSIGNLGKTQTATITVPLTPTIAQPLVSSGTVGVTVSSSLPSIDNNPGNNTASVQIPVVDFSLSANPSTQTVAAGNSATYQVTVTPVPTFPNNVTLACSSGLPTTGAKCVFSTASVTLTGNSASTSTLTITTTARPATTGAVHKAARALYAVFFPITGLALFGAGLGRKQRRRRWMMAMLLCVLAFSLGLQIACGGGKSTATVTPGTAAGTYTVDITGTSGNASHATAVTLVVQ